MPAEGYYWCMSLLLKDRSFLERWAKQIEPEDFPDGPLRVLSATVLAYWFEHKQLLTRPALRATLEEYTTEDNTTRILGYYEELLEEYPVDDESLPRLRELAAQWLERRWVGRAVDSALNALEIGKTKKALDSLLGVRRVLAEDEPPLSTTRSDWDKRTVYTPQMDIAIPTKLAELDDLWDGGIHPGEFAILLAATNIGKALSLDTKLPTPEGWTTMGEISVGNKLFDEEGEQCRVTGVSPIMEGRLLYAVEFTDGTIIKADAEHLWSVGKRFENNKRRYLLTTQDIFSYLQRRKPNSFYYTSIAKPLCLPEKELPLDPYILGVWLGDGTARGGQVTTADEQIFTTLQEAGYSPSRLGGYCVGTRGLYRQLRLLNLLCNKHIPSAYLRTGFSQRLALLQGLMDTDGSINMDGSCEFCNKNEQITIGVRELLHSLGMRARQRMDDAKLRGKLCGKRHRLYFQPTLPVFRLERKLARQRLASVKQERRYIKQIVPIESAPVRCITVDSFSHLFLAGESMVPTHNSMGMAHLAAQAFKADKKVLFFTFELSPTQIARRFMGALFQQPVIKLPRESRSMIQAYAEEHNLTRASFEVREDIETVNDLRTMLEQMQKEGNLPDVVFLDSADDLHMRSEKLYEGLSEIYTSLRRDITRNFGVALWTSTQATRDAVDKARVNLKQVADCFVKARRCHLMIGFSQTEEELNNTEGEGLPKLKLFVLKDSLHGSRGRGYAMYATFGRGSDGYPGFKWIKADAFADFIDEE